MIRITYHTEALGRLLTVSGPTGRTRLIRGAAMALAVAIQRHLTREAKVRHTTARRLGAEPTGHLEKAADSVQTLIDGETAVITVSSPGIARAFGPVEIRPRTAKALTIPIAAPAYGHRASELSSRGWALFTVPGKKTRGILFGKKSSGEVLALYALKSHVTLPADPSLLPGPEVQAQATGKAIAKLLQNSAKGTR